MHNNELFFAQNKPVNNQLEVIPSSLVFGGLTELTKNLSINASGSWTITNNTDWITLNKDSGTGNTSVQVTAGVNIATSPRDGQLVIKSSSGMTKTVYIEQRSRDSIAIIVGGDGGYLTKLTI